MGDHRIVTCNGTADLTIEGVQNGAARGIFDDELDQVHDGGIGKASGSLDEENGKVLGVIHEVAEDGAVCPPRGAKVPWIARPGMERGSSYVGISDAAQGIGEGGGIAADDVDVPPVGGGDEPAVGASLSRIAGEGAARVEVLHGLPGGGEVL